MKSFSTLSTLFTSLSQNTSSANTTLGKQFINDQHRYLIQKYFDNLQTEAILTAGGQSLTLTGSLAAGAVSATLNSAWAQASGVGLVTFSNSDQRLTEFQNNSTAITWLGGLTATATTAITLVGIQGYDLPQNISKIKDVTINNGQIKYVPVQIITQNDWDKVNFLPYTSNIPSYYYIYNNRMYIFPIPSTSNFLITFNYKRRVPDMTYSDYTTGTAAMTAGSVAVTGSSTSWNTTGLYPLNKDLQYANLFISFTPPKGDGQTYQILSFQSDTALTLNTPVIDVPVATGVSYTIGQYPLLSEDFHDMIVYGALKIYFSSIVKDMEKYKEFDALYKERIELLADYAGTRSTNVDLGTEPAMVNPNLFILGT